MKRTMILCLIVFSFKSIAQNNLHDFGFVYYDSISVQDELGGEIVQPWVGGMNFCQYSSCDFNFDGVNDLFVFDRSGNRKLVFENNGSPNSTEHKYRKGYAHLLPSMKEWAFFLDFNNDGKEDLFTYTTGGIAVYKNSSSNGELSFNRITRPFIYSLQGSVLTNLYVTPVDLPAVADIDGDGDYDILTFWGLGQYVQYHKNFSMETYGHADSLIYELVDYCWGDFEESEESNVLTLNIDCPFKENGCTAIQDAGQKDRHAGSTLLAIDLDNDNDKDLLLGDIDYPNLLKLDNGGSALDAHIIAQDTLYPSSNPIDLISFPAAFYIDVDNDAIKDLIVSPFDEKTFNPVSENINSSWFYKNIGTNGAPIFNFIQEDFLQEQMIDFGAGSYPVILDFNHDGLMDIAVSNYGYRDSSYYNASTLYSTYRSQIALLENIGDVNNPQYKIIDNDLADISELELQSVYPSFYDIDGDSDIDMLLGNSTGTLFLYENLSQSNYFDFSDPIEDYMSIDVGDYSTPQLFDINEDGLVDILIGCKLGKIFYYKNIGSLSTPEYELISSELGGVDVRDLTVSNFGYSIPCFFKVNDEFRLFVGSESGKIFYYKGINDNLEGVFELYDDNLLFIYEGQRIGLAASNFDNDDYIDLIIGNYAGGLSFYKGENPHGLDIKEDRTSEEPQCMVNIYPQPSKDELTVEALTKDINLNSLELFTLTSELVLFSRAQGGKVNLNLDGLKRGFYVLRICLEKRDHMFIVNKKVVVH